ncbi:MAG: UDP-N-acetylglucosamine--N-acetylmuramyl-(pentapeptide) pyrophosphoryl-undecaprenol N-acetylglucosamine transferase [Clostridia bacterium]|nr:UDP-N-acetylglucosamine--N-acetylmuramyl-(pentapeptide) pyrophosphoryl-undecaprenol N-acetylglucosamine transferase [Clostridia bacterium]
MEKIVLTGGGTAGHIYPALAVAELLKDKYEIHYIGGVGMEKDIIAKEKDIIFHQIDTVKLERKLTLKNLLIPFKLIRAISNSKKILRAIKPVAVFSKGGYVSLPVVMGANKLKIKVISHESDLSMGLANKIILRYCDYMCTAFEKTSSVSPKCIFTGQPIRKEVLNGNKNNLPFYSKLNHSLPNLLIVGGSSGAGFLNKIVKENLDFLCQKFNLIHIMGRNKFEKIEHKNYHQFEYATNMGDFLNLADFVISRAGSGAINEFLSLSKPMLLIPLSKACSRGDQIENAKLFCDLGYAIMLEEEEYNCQKFIEKIDNLVKNDIIFIKNMKKSIKNDAKQEIFNVIQKAVASKK